MTGQDGPSPGLLRSSLAYWLAAAVTIAGSLVRGKVAAVQIGASGVGTTSQLNMLAFLLMSLAMLGLGNAGVIAVAEARRRSTDSLGLVVQALVITPLVASFGLALICSLFAGPISHLLLGFSRPIYVIAAISSLPLNIVIAVIPLILQGMQRTLRFFVGTVIMVTGSTLCFIALVSMLGLTGAILGIPATSLVSAAVLVVREPWILVHCWPIRRPDRTAIRSMYAVGGAGVALATVTYGADLVIRSAIVHTYGLSVNGLVQPAYLLSGQVLAQIAIGLSVALFPRVVAHGAPTGRQITNLVNSGIRLACLVVVPAVMLLTAFRAQLILLAFDTKFIPGANVLALMMTGELSRALAAGFAAVLLPSRKVRAWLSIQLSGAMIRLTVTLGLLSSLGARAVAVGFATEWAVNMAVLWLYCSKQLGFRVEPQVFRTVAIGEIVCISAGVSAAFTHSIYLNMALAVSAPIWVRATSTQSDRDRVRQRAMSLLSQRAAR